MPFRRTLSRISFVILTLLLGCGLLFAGALEARSSQLSSGVERQLFEILESGTRSSDIPARGRSVEAIVHLRPEESAKYALDALGDPQWLVRRGALKGLIRVGHAGVDKALGSELIKARPPLVPEVLEVFALLPQERAVALLFNVLDTPEAPNPEVVIEALVASGGPLAEAAFTRAFGGRGEPHPLFRAALPKLNGDSLPLLAAAAESSNPEVLSEVLGVARELPEDASLGFLLPLLRQRDGALRVAAAKVLAARGFKEAIPVLLPLLEGENVDQQEPVLHALAGVPTPEVLRAAEGVLTARLIPDPTEFARLADGVFSIFAAAGDKELLPALQGFITGTDAQRREVAVRHLGRVQGAQSLPTLHKLLFDGSPTIRRAAAESLGHVAESESLPHLERAMEDNVPEVRQAAIRAIAGLNDKESVGVVSFLISDQDRIVRLHAVRALAALRDASAQPSLRIALGDRDPEIRFEALRGLLKIDANALLPQWSSILNWLPPDKLGWLAAEHGESIKPFLQIAFTSSRESIRAAAVGALDSLETPTRLKLLVGLAERARERDVRLLTITRLADEQEGGVVPLLHRLADDRDKAVQRAALEALAEVGERSSTDVIEAYLADDDGGIRIVAAYAIVRLMSR